MRILLIHGRAQGGKDPDALEEVWTDTLRIGMSAANISESRLRNVNIDFPFYGDALDRFTEQSRVSVSPATPKGPNTYSEFEKFYAEVMAELEEHTGVPENEVTAQLPPSAAIEKGPANWEWVHAVARVIDRHLTGVTVFSIETFLRDVFLYVRNSNVKKAINKIVTDKLTDEPTIVVGHSLGTVVGYDIIRANKNSHKFLKYITLGSPLGIRGIAKYLGVVENPVQDKWFNAFDEGDIVALNPLNKPYFDVTPEIYNYGGVDNHTDNQHGIVGYLNNPIVARHVFSEVP